MADLPLKKYTLVRAANGDLYLVGEEGETVNIARDYPALQSQIEQMSPQADEAVSALFAQPLGSGVRVRVPKILD